MVHTPPGVFWSVGKWMSHHDWYEFDSNQENTQIPVKNYFELQLQISSSFVLFHAFLNSRSIILIGVQIFVSVVTAPKESRITKSKRLPERKEEQQPCWEVSSWQHCKRKMKIFCKCCKTHKHHQTMMEWRWTQQTIERNKWQALRKYKKFAANKQLQEHASSVVVGSRDAVIFLPPTYLFDKCRQRTIILATQRSSIDLHSMTKAIATCQLQKFGDQCRNAC
jgi:hypothetical protein